MYFLFEFCGLKQFTSRFGFACLLLGLVVWWLWSFLLTMCGFFDCEFRCCGIARFLLWFLWVACFWVLVFVVLSCLLACWAMLLVGWFWVILGCWVLCEVGFVWCLILVVVVPITCWFVC